jgi:hypothetical protein
MTIRSALSAAAQRCHLRVARISLRSTAWTLRRLQRTAVAGATPLRQQ